MQKKENKVRVIAFYLPQFHPIPENDDWWGKGFTEWTNVCKAKPLFKGHDQPKLPADLGYYDLRVPETRKAQADLAKTYGVDGFCYWHYWFGNGKRLLERPFNEVLSLGEPDFPFCLAWANETWKGFAHGMKNRNILIEQLYPGARDDESHFFEILPAFKDQRYLTIDDKPIFLVYKPLQHPHMTQFIDLWQKLAKENGLKGVYFIGHSSQVAEIDEIKLKGFNAVNINRLYTYLHHHRSLKRRVLDKFNKVVRGVPLVYTYKNMLKYFTGPEDARPDVFPSVFPNWDHSPRSGREGVVFQNSTPEYFKKHLSDVFGVVLEKEEENQVVFLKSWNEWAEGNYMEPDTKFGLQYLEALNEVKKNKGRK